MGAGKASRLAGQLKPPRQGALAQGPLKGPWVQAGSFGWPPTNWPSRPQFVIVCVLYRM